MTSLFFQHIDHVQQRTNFLLENHGFDQLLIGSGSLHTHFLDDTRYPFRANPHFLRWVPFLAEHPDCWLLIRPQQKPVLFCYTPTDFWHMTPSLPTAPWTHAFEVHGYDNIEAIAPLLQGHNTAVINEQTLSLEIDDSTALNHNPAKLITALDFYQAVKTEWEQYCLREANYLAVQGHAAAEAAFQAGSSEFEIHQFYLNAIAHNARDLPYDNIVGLNEHAAVLHYQFQQRKRPARHHSLLIDAGARFNGYAADITRTFTAEGTLFADLVAALDNVQQAICGQIRSGVSFVELHQQTHRLIAELLHQFGLVNASPDAQIEQGITRTFFPHGLGHLLGVQVHDAGGRQIDEAGTQQSPPEEHPFLRLTRTLETGFVVTVEPGLYFIPQLLSALRDTPAGAQVNWEQIEQLMRFGGIRIEDNVCVLPDGCENYTRDGFGRL